MYSDFTAAAPKRVWLADITYIPTDEGLLYLAAVMLFSRKIVGWSMRDHLRPELAATRANDGGPAAAGSHWAHPSF